MTERKACPSCGADCSDGVMEVRWTSNGSLEGRCPSCHFGEGSTDPMYFWSRNFNQVTRDKRMEASDATSR